MPGSEEASVRCEGFIELFLVFRRQNQAGIPSDKLVSGPTSMSADILLCIQPVNFYGGSIEVLSG